MSLPTHGTLVADAIDALVCCRTALDEDVRQGALPSEIRKREDEIREARERLARAIDTALTGAMYAR